MKGEKSVARATVAVWRIQAALAALIVMGAGGTVILFIMEQPWGPIATAFWLAGLVVLLGLAWWLPGLAKVSMNRSMIVRRGIPVWLRSGSTRLAAETVPLSLSFSRPMRSTSVSTWPSMS